VSQRQIDRSQEDRLVATRYRHPVNKALIEEAPLGARVADVVTGFMGSWRFIIIQTIIVAMGGTSTC
jgi:uncharacterized membrane protein